MWWQQQHSQRYVRLPQISVTDEEGKSEQHQDFEYVPEKRPMVPSLILLGLAVSNAIFMVTTGVMWVQLRAVSFQLDLAQRVGFTTDLDSAQSSLTLQEKTFSGALRYNATKQEVYRDVDLDSPNYFGDPRTTPGIDEAWTQLMKGEFFAMTDEEAAPFVPELAKVPVTGKFHGELDVFHSLHCLNAVRMHLDKDYYMEHGGLHQDSDQWPSGWSRAHLDHCLDHLRQSIKCSSDLSIVPMYKQDFMVGTDNVLLGRGHKHTCRDFSKVRQWLDRRNAQSPPLSEF